MNVCTECGKELTHDEIGLYKKMVNRGATEFLCLPCLAKYFSVSEAALCEKIVQFKEMHCTLFE